MKPKNQRYCKDCRNSFKKDDRDQSVSCYDGMNYDFDTCRYDENYATKCKWYVAKKSLAKK